MCYPITGSVIGVCEWLLYIKSINSLPRFWIHTSVYLSTFYPLRVSHRCPGRSSDEILWITPSYQWHRCGESGFVSRNFRKLKSLTDLHMSQTNLISLYWINKMFVCEDSRFFYYLKKLNSLNFCSFCVLDIVEMTLSQKRFC